MEEAELKLPFMLGRPSPDTPIAKQKDIDETRDSSSGMGYCVLESDKELAMQIISEHTIYDIRYNFELDNNEVLTIPFNCILNFSGGSISNGTIVGDDTALQGAIHLIRTELSGTFLNSKFNVAWWGGNPSSNNNDEALAACINSCHNCGILFFLPQGEYKFATPIECYGNFDIEMIGVLVYTGDKDATALTIGHEGSIDAIRSKKYRVSIKQQTAPTYTINAETNTANVVDNIGVKFINIYESNIRIEFVSNFAYGVVFSANGSGCVYNYVNIGSIRDGYRLLTLYSAPTEVGRSWVNENVFIGGRLWCSSSCAVKSIYRAISIGMTEDVEYKNNNNVFLKPSLEGAYIALEVLYGRYNTMLGARMERVTLGFVERNGSYGNYVINGYGNVTGDYYMSSRITRYSLPEEINSDIRIPVYANNVGYVKDSSKNLATIGIRQCSSSNDLDYFAPVYSDGSLTYEPYYADGLLDIPIARFLCVDVNTEVAKRFMVTLEGNARISYLCYDANGDVMQEKGLMRGTSPTAITYNDSINAYITSTNTVNDSKYFSVTDDVKKVRVRIGRGTWNDGSGNISIGKYKSLSIYANQYTIVEGRSADICMPSKPSEQLGDIMYVRNANISNIKGWTRLGDVWIDDTDNISDIIDANDSVTDSNTGAINGMFAMLYTKTSFSKAYLVRNAPLTINNSGSVNTGNTGNYIFGKLYNLNGIKEFSIEVFADSSEMSGQYDAVGLMVVPLDDTLSAISPTDNIIGECDDYYDNSIRETQLKIPHWYTKLHIVSNEVIRYKVSDSVKNIAIFIQRGVHGLKKIIFRSKGITPDNVFAMSLPSIPTTTGVSVKEGCKVFDNSNTIEGWVLFGDIWKAVIPTNTGT